jgi:hypothetical protein
MPLAFLLAVSALGVKAFRFVVSSGRIPKNRQVRFVCKILHGKFKVKRSFGGRAKNITGKQVVKV